MRLFCCMILVSLAACGPQKAPRDTDATKIWRALQVVGYNNDARLKDLTADLPKLAGMGVNTLILEVNYFFEWESHPELRQGSKQVSRDGARAFSEACKQQGIRVIPYFQCLSRQSDGKKTFPLLAKYPKLDIVPEKFPDNEEIFAREWDPFELQVNEIVFKLLDELLDAFQADALHVGMDRVMLLGHEDSPGTYGQDNAMVFARVAHEMHNHLVVNRKVEMLMWADRLVDGSEIPYGEWESSHNDTWAALDMIPSNIILCTWNNQVLKDYPATSHFLEKGFRVMTAGGSDLGSTKAVVAHHKKLDNPNLLGHIFTPWQYQKNLPSWPPLVKGMKKLNR